MRVPGIGTMKGRLGKQPRQGDLGRSGVLRVGPTGEEVDEGPVCLQVLCAPPREIGALVVLGVESGVRVDLPSQVALAEWTPGDEPDAQFLARVQDAVAFGLALPQRVFGLDRSHG